MRMEQTEPASPSMTSFVDVQEALHKLREAAAALSKSSAGTLGTLTGAKPRGSDNAANAEASSLPGRLLQTIDQIRSEISDAQDCILGIDSVIGMEPSGRVLTSGRVPEKADGRYGSTREG